MIKNIISFYESSGKLYQSFYNCLAPVQFYDINTTEFIFYVQLGN